MSDGDGDGIWELTIPLLVDFMNTNLPMIHWAGSRSLIRVVPVPSPQVIHQPCTGRNRRCYPRCGLLGELPELFRYHHLCINFFSRYEQVAGPSLHLKKVNGGWDGWCGGCTPLDPDGDGIWSTTKMLEPDLL